MTEAIFHRLRQMACGGYLMKINRLLEITIVLLNKGTVPARELAVRFGVSTRTIYRDIDLLSTAGVPVYTTQGNGGGIALLENFTLDKTIITERESESLLLALKTLQATQYPETEAVLDKLGAVFKNSAADWVEIDFSAWGSKPNESDKFIEIKQAILGRKRLSFDYVNAGGDRSRRTVEPVRLIFKSQAWYLWGYCLNRRDYRVFRISRIKNVTVTDELFQRSGTDARSLDASSGPGPDRVTLKLKFQPQVLHRIYDDFDEELIVKNPDGTFLVTVTFPEDEWVYGFILSFGCYVEVIEPERIREIVVRRMRKALGFYEESRQKNE
jgi:predicted DNA-binding transcriptional regulator YafY